MNTTQVNTENSYQKQANDFLEQTGVTFEAKFLENGKHFTDDKDVRDIYKITLKRGRRKYSFKFGQSIANSQYYQDKIKERTYTLSGGSRTGNYSINDISKYQGGLGFGQQMKIVAGKTPTAYDVLVCLTKYDPGTFEDFCSEFGYDTDSRKAEKTYMAVKDEWQNVCALFTDSEIEQLQEMQ